MGEPLNEMDVRLLHALGVANGFTTGTVLTAAGLPKDRRTIAKARQCLLHMVKVGLVREMDREKPTIWQLTAAGSQEAARRLSKPTPALPCIAGEA